MIESISASVSAFYHHTQCLMHVHHNSSIATAIGGTFKASEFEFECVFRFLSSQRSLSLALSLSLCAFVKPFAQRVSSIHILRYRIAWLNVECFDASTRDRGKRHEEMKKEKRNIVVVVGFFSVIGFRFVCSIYLFRLLRREIKKKMVATFGFN